MMRSWPVLWVLLAAAGCSATGDDIDAVDSGRLTGMVRVTIDDSKRQGEEPGQQTKSTMLGEITLSYVDGRDEQSIDPGDKVVFADKEFRGPLNVDADFAVLRVNALARLGHDLDRTFGVEAIVGASLLFIEMDFDSPIGSKVDTDASIGPVVGAQVNVRPFEMLTLYGRGLLLGGIDIQTGETISGAAAFEAGVEVNVLDQVYLFGGWRAEGLHELRHEESELFLDLSGPFAGLGLRF